MVPEKDGAARHPGICGAGTGSASLMAHLCLQHGGPVATARGDKGKAPGGEAPRTGHAAEQRSLSNQEKCIRVRLVFLRL